MRKALPVSRNAYPELVKVPMGSLNRIDLWLGGESLGPEKPLPPRKILALTQSQAEAIDRALARGGFQWPKPDVSAWLPVPSAMDSVPPSSLSLSRLGRIRLSRATAFSQIGKVDQAVRELESLAKLTRWAGAGNPLAIHYLLVGASERNLAKGVVNLAKKHRLSRGQIARLRRALGPAQTVDPDLALMVKVELNEFTLEEYQRVPLRALLQLDDLLTFSFIPNEGPKAEDIWPVDDPDLLDRRATLAMSAQETARALPDLSRPWPVRNREPDDFIRRKTDLAPERPWETDERDPRPEELAAFRRAAERVPNAFGLYKLRGQRMFDVREVALGRLAYRSLALAALAVEDGSRQLPIDPASLKPICYDPKTRRIYSVGPNGRDEHGNGDDWGMSL